MTDIFNFVSNPIGAGLSVASGLTLYRGADKFKENIAVTAIGLCLAAYFFPAWFGLKAAAASVGNAAVDLGQQAYSFAQSPMDGFLNLIGKYESGGVTNILNGGATFPVDSTVDQVKAFGKAAGERQIMPNNPIAGELGIPGNANFIANEPAMARGLAVKRGWREVVSGKMSIGNYIKNGLANEWCAVPTGPEGMASAACIAAGNPAKVKMPFVSIFNEVSNAVTAARSFGFAGMAP